MSLPQRKKTAEELAKLREDLGIPDAPPPGMPGVAPADRVKKPKPPAASKVPEKQAAPSDEPLPVPAAKPVRSLRKSERLPAAEPKPIERSATLPNRRHKEEDLDEIRRREAFAIQSPAIHLQALAAHPVMIGGAYALVIATLVTAIMKTHGGIVLACGIAALAAAAYIFLKKKRSTHHAGFIAAITILTLIFSALHYFPQLRNAS